MIRRPPRSTHCISSAASDVYKRQHINISDHNLTVKGGHLFEAIVAVVGEFILTNINSSGKRLLNPKIGLACMQLGG